MAEERKVKREEEGLRKIEVVFKGEGTLALVRVGRG